MEIKIKSIVSDDYIPVCGIRSKTFYSIHHAPVGCREMVEMTWIDGKGILCEALNKDHATMVPFSRVTVDIANADDVRKFIRADQRDKQKAKTKSTYQKARAARVG